MSKYYTCHWCEETFQIEYGDLYVSRNNKDLPLCDDCAKKIVISFCEVQHLNVVTDTGKEWRP